MQTHSLTLLAGLALAAAAALLFARPASANDVVKEPSPAPAPQGTADKPAGPLDFTLKTIDGQEQKLGDFRGKVVMFVNVATHCGNTPQYEGLQKLHEKYKDQGLTIVGVPANNFGGQEPGSDKEIKEFCTSKYKVGFPMMSKISVKGDDQHPLYKYLTGKDTAGEFAGDVEWNFGKFLIDRNGNLMARFHPKTKPQDEKVVAAVVKALAAKPAEEPKKEGK